MGHGEMFRATICTAASSPEKVRDFGRFRKKLFVDSLGWDLTVQDGIEADEFDDENAVYCILNNDKGVCGGFRAIRSDRPYLAERIFPALASVRPYPKRRDVWEISRFGVELGHPGAGRLNYALMFRFGQLHKAVAFVAVADLTYERFLSTLGVRTRRYGPPRIVGHDSADRPLELVAGEIPLIDQSGRRFAALIRLSQDMAIEDLSDAPGCQRISA